MYHYTYMLTSKEDGRMYIGVRSCKCKPSEDFLYMSSCTVVSDEYKKNCTKQILAEYSTRKEAADYEVKLHNIFDVGANPQFFNGAKQTSSGFDLTGIAKSEEFKKLVSAVHKNKIVSDETKKKRSDTVKRKLSHPDYVKPLRKPITDEAKANMKKAQKAYVASENYINPFQDKLHSDKTKALISKANKLAWEGQGHKSRTFKPWFIHNIDTGELKEFFTTTKTEYAISKGYRSRCLLDATNRSKAVKPVKCIEGRCIVGNIEDRKV